MRFLAVDVGGTSTRAVVVEEDGACVGYGAAGSGNPTSSGLSIALTSIVAATHSAIERSGNALDDLAGASVGIAGAAGDRGAALRSELVDAGLPASLALEPDLLVAFLSGSLATDGYAVVAGTGSAAVRVRDSHIEATCDGLGWLLGDGGSGFWLGHRAVLAASGALDGRGPSTVLVDLVLAKLGISMESAEHLVGGRPAALGRIVAAIYQLRPIELAEFAPLVFEAERVGDSVAQAIIVEAASALSATLAAVVVPDLPGPLVLSGSVLSKQRTIAEQVVATFRERTGETAAITVSDGVVGAVVLALRRAGTTVDGAVFERVRTSLASLR